LEEEIIKSKREESGFIPKTPLKDFICVSKTAKLVDRTGKFAKPGQKLVIWEITDLEVIESDEPYDLKTAVIGMNYSDSANSGYVVFEDSIAEAFGVPVDEATINLTFGAKIHVQREDNHLFFVDKNKRESRGRVFRIVEVLSGAPKKVSAKDRAIELLAETGNKDDFVQAAIADSTIKKNGKLCSDIITGKFFESNAVTEAFDIEDETYTLKG
jgi:hypothetical protein